MIKIYDLHGYNLEEAIKLIDKIISEIRIKGKEEVIEIITGRGIIRQELEFYLKKQEIDYYFALGNDGKIIMNVN